VNRSFPESPERTSVNALEKTAKAALQQAVAGDLQAGIGLIKHIGQTRGISAVTIVMVHLVDRAVRARHHMQTRIVYDDYDEDEIWAYQLYQARRRRDSEEFRSLLDCGRYPALLAWVAAIVKETTWLRKTDPLPPGIDFYGPQRRSYAPPEQRPASVERGCYDDAPEEYDDGGDDWGERPEGGWIEQLRQERTT